jgi:hypothetical protein
LAVVCVRNKIASVYSLLEEELAVVESADPEFV